MTDQALCYLLLFGGTGLAVVAAIVSDWHQARQTKAGRVPP